MTISDILDQIAAALHLAGQNALAPFWNTIAPWALGQATADRLSILASRGLTTAQIGTWSGADSFDISQATFWALTRGGGLEEVDLEATKMLDLRGWLRMANLVDGTGAIVKASSVGKGTIHGGWDDAKAREPVPNRLGFIDPSTGRLRGW